MKDLQGQGRRVMINWQRNRRIPGYWVGEKQSWIFSCLFRWEDCWISSCSTHSNSGIYWSLARGRSMTSIKALVSPPRMLHGEEFYDEPKDVEGQERRPAAKVITRNMRENLMGHRKGWNSSFFFVEKFKLGKKFLKPNPSCTHIIYSMLDFPGF